MVVTVRPYRGTDLDGDFVPVRDFLRRLHVGAERPPVFGWSRWEWAFAQPGLDRAALHRVGVWEREGRVVAVATFEDVPGDAYLAVDPGCAGLLPEVLDHALAALRGPHGVRVLVDDADVELQRLARSRGLVATQHGDEATVLELEGGLAYPLPAGYRVQGLDQGVDLGRLERLMHRGFGQDGEPAATPEALAWRERAVSSPSQDPSLSVLVVADDGTYAAYCGTWWHEGDHAAVVEPVCTDPDHRRRGLGRAAVLEAVRRCAARGAPRAQVGSHQQFYYALGFAPRVTATWWTVLGGAG